MEVRIESKWKRNALVHFYVLSLAVALSACAVNGNSEGISSETSLPNGRFKAARLKDYGPDNRYPESEQKAGREGWVAISVMVDAKGRSFEPTVTASSGNKKLEEAALKSAEGWQFSPATVNGQPVESAFETRLNFSNGKGASKEFVDTFTEFSEAVKRNDRTAADGAMAKLQINTLYEDAYVGLVQFEYARHWGTKEQQLAGLKRAIAREPFAGFLTEERYARVLEAEFPLQLEARDYTGAIWTFEDYHRARFKASTLNEMGKIVRDLQAHRNDPKSFSVAGEIERGSWYFGLFKKHFQFRLLSGHISELKLRCQRKYAFFPFDPALVYEASGVFGRCSIQVVGDPGTKFELIQS